ncbi:uncharacterized protein LOC125831505 [Solanum verrucosum]|uniref:uncharacterized protein LOC125831505 n=1 Tax=Solanum verrucosum TaxID=315347 RepID=UPI0020D0ED01|nr:uncharacterized protein LOC125831505 [Solanum verrucosum]
MENYTLWSRAMEIALLGRNKLGFIDGSVLRTDIEGNLKKNWDRCNAVVISWLIWRVSTVSTYFTKLKNLWDEYDSILPPPSCDCHKAKKYVKHMQYQRLLQFLMGLHDSYSQARGQILMMHTLPNVNQAYALIIQDESQKGIAGHISEGMESLALYTARNNKQQQYPRKNYQSLYCDFYNMKGHVRADCNKLKKCDHFHATGHVKADCYQLIGYLDNFKGKKKVNAVLGDQINTMIDALKKSSCSSSNVNMAGNLSLCLKWIIDTKATDHMICDHNYLYAGNMVKSTSKVQLPTGDLATVTHIGSFQLNESDLISDVLCIPDFKFNLLSNLLFGKVKGIGEVDDGLYVLHWRAIPQKALSAASRLDEDPALWHQRWTWTFLIHLKSDVIVVLKQFLAMIKNRFGKCVKVFRSDNEGEFMSSNCHDLFALHGIIHQRSCSHTPQQSRVVERKHRHLLETTRAIKIQGHLPDRFWGECIEAATYIINRVPLTVLENLSPYEIMFGKQPFLTHLRVIGCLAFATSLRKDDKFAPKARKVVLLGYAVNQKGYKLLDIESRIIFVSRDITFYKREFPFQLSSSGDTIDPIFPMLNSHVEDCELTPCIISRNDTICSNDEGQPNDSQASQPDDMSQNQTTSSVLPNVVVPAAVVRKSNRPAKPPLWHIDYVLSKKLAGNCLYPIVDMVDYNSITPTYRSFVTKLSQEKEPASYREAIQDPKWVEDLKLCRMKSMLWKKITLGS